MRIGSENRKVTIFALVLFAIAVVMIVRMFGGFGGAPSPRPANPVAANQTPAAGRGRRIVRARSPRPGAEPAVSLDPRLRLDLLKASEDTAYTGAGRNIFLSQAEVEIPKQVTNDLTAKKNQAPGPQTPVVNTPPPPPPINLKFFGFANQPGQQKRVFLADGDDVFVAAEGDIVDRRYKIVKISNNSIEVQDVLNNNRQTIPLTQG